MRLNFITCSGANEMTSIPQLLSMLEEFPIAEIGVQVSEKKAAKGMMRYKWIQELHQETMHSQISINAALHVNRLWAEAVGQGKMPAELTEFLQLSDNDGNPFFQRVQLNFKVGREQTPNVDKLDALIRQNDRHRFILSYNESNSDIIRELYLRGVKFDCLYDSSFGEGVMPQTRMAPAFVGIRQGYAGGITPNNVTTELGKIAREFELKPNGAAMYIDAEKGLADKDGNLDLAKMLAYLINAITWYQNYVKNAS